MTAPYDKFLRSLRDGDSESEKMRKLLHAYPSLGKGFARFRKQDGGEAIAGTWPRGPFADEDTPPPDPDPDADLEDDEEEDDDEARHREEDDDAAVEAASKHFVDVLADLLVTANEGKITKPEALRHLMHTARGAALVRRLHHQKRLQEKEQTMTTTRAQDLQRLAKDFGPVKLAKHLIENGPFGLSEHEFTAMVESYAKANGTTFVKLFEAPDSDGLAIRKATQLLKRHPVAEAAPRAAAGTVFGSAYDELVAKAEALRKREPSLTREQAFCRVFEAPENVAIVKRERAESRPHA
jgi:hypothetical protein